MRRSQGNRFSIRLTWPVRVSALLGLFLLLIPAAWAQLPQAGDTTSPPTPGVGHDYIHAPQETVNPANGSVSIRIPVRISSGRELTIPFSIAYDSNGAFYYGSDSGGDSPALRTVTGVPFSQGGWSYTFPLLTFDGEDWTVDNGSGKPYDCSNNINYVFQDPTGNRHNLGLYATAPGAGQQDCGSSITQGGEGPIVATIPSGQLQPPVTLTDGNGTVYSFPSGFMPTSVTDRNGNTISISSTSSSAAVTDTAGRAAVSVATFGMSPDSINVAGLSSPYRVSWTTASPNFTIGTLNANISGDPACPTLMRGSIKVASQIVLPNGQTYAFTYDPTYGMLSKMTYPSGGYVRYVWGLNPLAEAALWSQTPASAWNCHYDSPAITDRYVSFDGTTEVLHQHFQYGTNWDSDFEDWDTKTTTVTTTDLVRGTSFNIVYTYSPVLVPCVPSHLGCGFGMFTVQMPVEQTMQYYSTSGTLLKTVGKTWCNGNPRELCSETTTLNDTGQVSETTYAYNTNEQQTERDEYDYGLQLTRKTVTNYASFTGGPIVDLPSSVITYNGSGARVAETDSSYDQTALQTTAVVQHTTAPGGSTRGNLTTVTKQCFNGPCSGGSPTTHYSYYDTGQIYQMTDPKGNVTTFSYTDNYSSCGGNAPPSGATNAYLTQVTYPTVHVNHIESYCYDYTAGLLRGSTDENSQTTSYTYADSLDRLTEANYPDGGETLVSYNDAPPTPSVTVEKEIKSGQFVTHVSMIDGIGLPIETELTSDPFGTDLTLMSYDGLGREYTVTNPYRSTGDPTYGVTTYAYDSLNRTTQVTHPDGSKIVSTYTGSATEISDEGNGTKSVQRISQTDGLGRMVSVCEVSSATQQGGSGTPAACGQNIAATGFLTTYTYDTLNNLLSVSQGSLGVRTFAYDSLSQLTSATNPESGLTSYTYDADGNVASRTQPEPNQTDAATTVTTTYLYDALNRLTAKQYSDSTDNVDYNYDETSPWGFTLTNTIGRLTTEYDLHTGSVFSYDPMGRILQNHQCTPQNCGTADFPISYTYDLVGDITSSTDGQYNLFTDTYDAAGQLTSLVSSYADPNHPGTLFSGAIYNAPGQITSDQLGNGINETRAYNSRLRMTSSVAGSAYTLNMTSYAPNGDILGVNDSVNGNWTYSYDDFNRLIGSSCNSHCPDGQDTQGFSYGYDRYANRWTQTVTAGSGGTSSLSFTGNDNHIDGYSYDAAGNLMNDGSHAYYYDAEHHLVQVDGSAGYCQTGTGTVGGCYVYDAEGRRVRRALTQYGATDDYLYDLSGHSIAQVSGTGWWVRDEIYAGGQHIATYENDLSTPTTFFTHADQLGTERVQTAVNGTSCETITSLAFGDGLTASGSCDPTALRFTGKQRDWESNLDYFGARYYSSQLGRWLSADWSAVPAPVPYANLSNPQTLNLYAMVSDNPETFADLDGHGDGCNTASTGSVGSSDHNNCPGPAATQNAKQGEGNTGTGTGQSTTQEALQALADTIIGLGKSTVNQVVDLNNSVNTVVDDAISPFTSFQFGSVPELQPSNPNQTAAMKSSDIALALVPVDGEVEGLARTGKITAEAEKAYPKLAGKFNEHHVMPKYLGGAKDGPTVRIPAAYHQLITNEFRRLAPYGQTIARSAEEVGRIMVQVYSKYPIP